MCETIPLPSDETMDIPTPLAEKNHANSSTSARLDAPPPASSSSSSSATSSSSAALLLRDAINGTPSMSRNVGASIDASEISSSRNLSGTTTSEERQGRALIKVVDGDSLSTSLSKLSLRPKRNLPIDHRQESTGTALPHLKRDATDIDSQWPQKERVSFIYKWKGNWASGRSVERARRRSRKLLDKMLVWKSTAFFF